MSDRGWRDPDLPDGVVRFPPERRPGRNRAPYAAVLLALLAAVAVWLLREGRLP
jgi:hypothetical protein